MTPTLAWDAHPDVIVNIVDHDKTLLTHHIPDGVTQMLEDLAFVTCPERDASVHIHTLPLQTQQFIGARVNFNVSECLADVNPV